MPRIKQQRMNHNERLRRDLIALYDRLTEFSDQCAFLCDAFAAIPICEESIDPATARGMGLSARWIKDTVREIKSDLKDIHEQSRAVPR